MSTSRRAARSARRPRLPASAAMALLLVGALSGCGTHLSPGAAATINGDAISQNHVDEVVLAACAYTAANAQAGGQPAGETSLANLRATITQALVQFDLADRAAAAMKLNVTAAEVSAAAAQNQLPSGLSDTDADVLRGFFQDFSRSSDQVKLIGAHLTDPSITTMQQVTTDKSAAATTYLETYASKQDVTVNPAYGVWTGSAVKGTSGSLSDPVSDVAVAGEAAASDPQADASALPASQVC